MARVCLRELTPEERATVTRLAHSRTAPAQVVQRAQIIWRASRGERASASLHVGPAPPSAPPLSGNRPTPENRMTSRMNHLSLAWETPPCATLSSDDDNIVSPTIAPITTSSEPWRRFAGAWL
jgi:hypothetical protein